MPRQKPHVTETGEPDGPGSEALRPDQPGAGTPGGLGHPPDDKDHASKDDMTAGGDLPAAGSSSDGPTMNPDETSSVLAAVLSVIEDVVDVRGQKITRPVLVRFAWFCVGAVFVLATVRPKSS